MQKSIRVKSAFTLIELIIVILLIGTTYYLVISNNSFKVQEKKENLTLENLKEFLIEKFPFEKNLDFFCIESDLSCHIQIDDIVQKDFKVEKLFKTIPEVYEYSKIRTRIDFEDKKVNDETQRVVFEFKIDNDFKTNEFILDDLQNSIYTFNSIYQKPKIYRNLDEVYEVFNTSEVEVRDAF